MQCLSAPGSRVVVRNCEHIVYRADPAGSSDFRRIACTPSRLMPRKKSRLAVSPGDTVPVLAPANRYTLSPYQFFCESSFHRSAYHPHRGACLCVRCLQGDRLS
jgi:hypothetical protein